MTNPTQEKIKWWREKPVWIMIFLGFSAGIPLWLIFSSLSLWLREAGVERSTVTYFSWAVLGYSFKFVWAPLVDKLPLPLLTNSLGRRRAWLLLSQIAVICSIVLMGMTDPQHHLAMMAIAAVLLGFSSATQDVVIDAYRIESAEPRLQAMLSSTYVAGYRIGMIISGAGALYLAESLGSVEGSYSYNAWRMTYLCMAAFMLIGIITTMLIPEPEQYAESDDYAAHDYLKFFGVFLLSIAALILVLVFSPSAPELFSGGTQKVFSFAVGTGELGLGILAALAVAKLCVAAGLVNRGLVYDGYQAPALDFFTRYGKVAVWVLLLVGLYRISDIVLGVITNVFYADMGYSKAQIASVSKVFGPIMTITGSFLGGLIALRWGVMRTLVLGAALSAVTNLLFVWLSKVAPETSNIALVIIVDNISQGIAIAAFIGWLSSLTNISFTATQYAIFSSIMTFLPKLLGGYSGAMVDLIGYANFFTFTALIGVPVIALIYFLSGKLEISEADESLIESDKDRSRRN